MAWVTKTVEVISYERLLDGRILDIPRRVRIEGAKVYGQLAVYEGSVCSSDGWLVLVLGIDRVACLLPNEKEAMRVAETLWDRCPSALCQKTPHEVIAALPFWVKGWLKRCRDSGKYQEP